MDWQMIAVPSIPDAKSYTEPQLTELAALSLVTYPRRRERLSTRLGHLVSESLAAFGVGPRSGWLQVPDFLMRHEADRK